MIKKIIAILMTLSMSAYGLDIIQTNNMIFRGTLTAESNLLVTGSMITSNGVTGSIAATNFTLNGSNIISIIQDQINNTSNTVDSATNNIKILQNDVSFINTNYFSQYGGDIDGDVTVWGDVWITRSLYVTNVFSTNSYLTVTNINVPGEFIAAGTVSGTGNTWTNFILGSDVISNSVIVTNNQRVVAFGSGTFNRVHLQTNTVNAAFITFGGVSAINSLFITRPEEVATLLPNIYRTIVIGSEAGTGLPFESSGNTIMGQGAGKSLSYNMIYSENTFIGHSSGVLHPGGGGTPYGAYGRGNTAVGDTTFYNCDGSYNSYFGYASGVNSISCFGNIAIGAYSGRAYKGSSNIFIGVFYDEGNYGNDTTHTQCVTLGSGVLPKGSFTTAIGKSNSTTYIDGSLVVSNGITSVGSALFTTNVNMTAKLSVSNSLQVGSFRPASTIISNTAYGASQFIYDDPTIYGTGARIGTSAYGSMQRGRIFNGALFVIGASTYGAEQCGNGGGANVTMGTSDHGSVQRGYFGNNAYWEMANDAYGCEQAGYGDGGYAFRIEATVSGAQQRGYNTGDYAMRILTGAHGASQFGKVIRGGATNSGIGSMQLLNLTNGQTAYMTGNCSIALGAVYCTNDESIVAGGGNVSHGRASITASNFWGDGSNVTNINANNITNNKWSITLSYGVVSSDTNMIAWYCDTQKAGTITNIGWYNTVGTPVADLWIKNSSTVLSTNDSTPFTGMVFSVARSNAPVTISYTAGQCFAGVVTNGVGTNCYFVLSGVE